MNLPPRWADELVALGHEADHWSTVGEADATDRAILAHAAANGVVLLTHDLDFGTILAASGASSPSVVTVRADRIDVSLLPTIATALTQFEAELSAGALVVVDTKRARARLLPLQPQ